LKANQKQQFTKRVVSQLFKYSLALTAVHVCIAAFIILAVWTQVSQEYIINWALLIVCALLISALYQTMFLRRNTENNFKHSKWESIYAFNGALVSLVFAAAYSFIAISINTLEYVIAFAAVMHISCIIFLSASSKKAMLGTSLPLAVPVIAAYVYISQAHTFIIAAAFIIFTSVLLLVGFSLCNTIRKGYMLKVDYDQQVNLSQSYLSKIQQTTIEDIDTEIFNRRFFDLTINQEVRRAKRAGTSFCMTIMKIDFFDQYIDNYGQEKANKCLRIIAKTLANATLRGGEYVTRFNKDSFAFTLPNVTSESAIAFSSKLIDLINGANIEHLYTGVKDVKKVSVSVGITEFKPGNIIDVEEIIEQASGALLHAINKGQNNIQVYSSKLIPLSQLKPTLVSNKTDVA